MPTSITRLSIWVDLGGSDNPKSSRELSQSVQLDPGPEQSRVGGHHGQREAVAPAVADQAPKLFAHDRLVRHHDVLEGFGLGHGRQFGKPPKAGWATVHISACAVHRALTEVSDHGEMCLRVRSDASGEAQHRRADTDQSRTLAGTPRLPSPPHDPRIAAAAAKAVTAKAISSVVSSRGAGVTEIQAAITRMPRTEADKEPEARLGCCA